MHDLDIVILAAGKGTRMRSQLPKVLHTLAGKPMVEHVLATASGLNPSRTHVVIGHGADQLRDALAEYDVSFALQEEQKGTGHAVAQAQPQLGSGIVLVLYGDVPLIRRDTLADLLAKVDEQHMGLLTVTLEDPSGYGRIVRDAEGHAVAIVEQKDANEEQLAINECNTGIMAMTSAQLKRWLPQLSAENAQGEYYLTDVIAMAASEGIKVATALGEKGRPLRFTIDRPGHDGELIYEFTSTRIGRDRLLSVGIRPTLTTTLEDTSEAAKDAGMTALQRIVDNTVESRLQNDRGLPSFDVRFFILNKAGDYAGVALYGSGESMFAVCDENGAREEPLEGLLEGPQR